MPSGAGAIGKEMPHAGVYVLASLISGVSTAFILTSAPSYTEPRSLQGAAYDVKRGPSTYDGCRAGPCQVAYCTHLLTLLPLAAAEHVHGPSASKLCGGLLLMGTLKPSYRGQYALCCRRGGQPRNNLAAHHSRVVYECVSKYQCLNRDTS